MMYFSFATENSVNNELCVMKLSEADLQQLREAIEDLYYFEFVVGKCEEYIPVQDRAGDEEEQTKMVWTCG